MKIIKHFILISIFFFLVHGCQNSNNVKEQDQVSIQSFEIKGADTCNRKDTKGRKQGLWHTFDHNNHNAIKDTLFYKDGVIVKNNPTEVK